MVTLVVVTGVLKPAPVVLLFATVRPWGRRIPRKILLVGMWLIGAGVVLYGGVNTLLHGLVMAEVITPEHVNRTALTWRLLFWNPWWILGGILQCAPAWNYYRLPSRG